MSWTRFPAYLACALTALVLVGRAPAEEAPKKAQTWMVLVGVSNYADQQIKPRLHAEDDAQAFYDVFIKKEYLGVDPKNVHLLLGSDDAKRGSQDDTAQDCLHACGV